MTKRYFYKCPISALYMQKEFGVQFECKNSDEEIQEYDLPEHDRSYPFGDSALNQADHIDDLIDEFQDFKNIYVTKKSEPIFLFKEGDIVKSDEYVGILGGSSPYESKSGIVIREEEPMEIVDNSEIEIIMRAGRNFLRPEIEFINKK